MMSMSETCLVCMMGEDAAAAMTMQMGGADGGRRLTQFLRKLGGHEGGDDDDDDGSERFMGCIGLSDMSQGDLMKAAMSANIGANADCQHGDMDVLASMMTSEEEPEEPEDVAAA